MVSPVASISLHVLIGSDVHHFVFTVYIYMSLSDKKTFHYKFGGLVLKGSFTKINSGFVVII